VAPPTWSLPSHQPSSTAFSSFLLLPSLRCHCRSSLSRSRLFRAPLTLSRLVVVRLFCSEPIFFRCRRRRPLVAKSLRWHQRHLFITRCVVCGRSGVEKTRSGVRNTIFGVRTTDPGVTLGSYPMLLLQLYCRNLLCISIFSFSLF